jgi:hypothetical protein
MIGRAGRPLGQLPELRGIWYKPRWDGASRARIAAAEAEAAPRRPPGGGGDGSRIAAGSGACILPR